MAYPTSASLFKELVQLRKRMRKKNADENVCIARPFVPFIGADILRKKPGLYFIGIATHGDWTSGARLEDAIQDAKDVAKTKNTKFWRYIWRVTELVYGGTYLANISLIAWSNQFKIGVYNKSGKG